MLLIFYLVFFLFFNWEQNYWQRSNRHWLVMAIGDKGKGITADQGNTMANAQCRARASNGGGRGFGQVEGLMRMRKRNLSCIPTVHKRSLKRSKHQKSRRQVKGVFFLT